MLSMGMTLELDDFRRVARMPRAALTGLALQYSVMPLFGFLWASVFDLPTPLAVGLILVSACPGGVASNVIAYLARGDVPLSVTMTALSTVSAVAMTPLLTALLAGSRVPVPVGGLLVGTVQVVLVPVAAGLMLNRAAPRLVSHALRVSPSIAVVLITLIVASVMGAARDQALASGARLLVAVIALHAAGFALGYWLARAIAGGETVARTVSIEVGMQNSGLGAVLARQSFADPATAVPSALASVCQSLAGSLLAACWRRRPPTASR
jgi:BASS family bile acid:Na+ symporter